MKDQIFISNHDEIVSGFKNGNMDAFRTIFEANHKAMHYYARQILNESTFIDDIIQASFLKLWENQGDFVSMPGIKSFLYKTVRNQCIDHIRHHKTRELFVNYQTSQHGLEEQEAFEYELVETDLLDLLNKAIMELPQGCREILNLFNSGLSISDISTKLDISTNTVKSQKQRAINLLREKMAKHHPLVLFLLSDQLF